MIELIKNTKIDFMGKKNIALAASMVLILLGLYTVFAIWQGTANLGIDFAGGTGVQIHFSQKQPLADIRKALTSAGLTDLELQDLPGENKIMIQTKKGQENLGEVSEKIVAALSKAFPSNKFDVDSTTEIGPKVGSKLRGDALKAVVAAILCILAYIAFRFQLSFGVGATFATLHDVMAVLGIFYILDKEINLILVSALLMIAGYSLTDTVVVFDRIRENLKKLHREPVNNVINISVNEVLSRTIITSLTTFLAALALFLFGGEVIHDFALAVMLGIIVGTYSSIFIASPVVLLWSRKKALSK